MGRIVFLSPFAPTEISGGIKTVHAHAAMLSELGFDAWVYQPEGRPTWFESRARLLTALSPAPDDVLVFPEILHGPFADLLRLDARKILFCQNHYFMALNAMPAAHYAKLGFTHFLAPSVVAQTFLERVLGLSEVAVVPCTVDPAIFFPREKSLHIAFAPRKLPREAALIRRIFGLKYPHLASVTWQSIDNAPEREAAFIMGRAAILLALNFFESFGLVPVEAMASGCVVAGFHGYGGQEYARETNGLWFAPDQAEETADALARLAEGFRDGAPEFAALGEGGLATAAHYSRERTCAALAAFYGGLVSASPGVPPSGPSTR